MNYIVSLLPIEAYIGASIVLCAFFVCGIIDMRQKKPGHPMTWWLPFVIFAVIASDLYKCADELTTNVIFQKTTYILSTIAVVLAIVSFVVTFILADKKGYTDRKKASGVIPALICCVIAIIVLWFSLHFNH